MVREAAPSKDVRKNQPDIHGFVVPGFEAVREAFAENFARRHELGGGCCIYHRGENVVNLWGGVRNKATGEAWEEDTMVVVHSASKGLSAMAIALAHSRGWLDYDERVCAYWPEFARHGKGAITVRQLLSHQAGLFAFDEPVDRSTIADPDTLAEVMECQKPAWEPGARQAYHALTLGFYESELLRRIDPQQRTLGQFFQEEIASPLGIDFYLRLPASIPNSRLATIAPPSPLAMLHRFLLSLTLAAWSQRSNIYRAPFVNTSAVVYRDEQHVYARNLYRALMVNPGTAVYHDEQWVYARELEVPSGMGVGNARAMARAYSEFATGGRVLELRTETLEALSAPAIAAVHGFFDECLMSEVRFSLGFMKPSPAWPLGFSDRAFGSPGSGGSIGFADPDAGVGYAYVTSQSGTTLTGDPRDVALRKALYSVLRS